MSPRLRPSTLALGPLGLGLLACSGGLVDCGRAAHTVIPAVREIDPEYATEPVDCSQDYPTEAARGCAIREISCGDVVLGNNTNGIEAFDEDFYQHKACTPQRHSYSKGPEAIYSLNIPANTWVDVVLASDCVDLDVFSANWDNPRKCPTPSHVNVTQCEADVTDRGGKITITTVDRPEAHLVWVDGKEGATGNFRLTVRCRTYR
ncbi:MAG: hypothetical protein RL071_3717 [Pseudomonadota bacterium]|jgi:hypothetical protein